MQIQAIDIIYFLLPSLIGYGTGMFCVIGKNAGNKVKFRPPPYVFGLVWPILFMLFGLSWVIASKNSNNTTICVMTYATAALFLGLWTYVYGCLKMKKEACWVILLSLATLLAAFSQGSEASKILISPLIAWIIFALFMNTTEVQESL